MLATEFYVDKVVIVRSWGDKPVKLSLRSVSQTHCYVGIMGSTKAVGIPKEQVSGFTEERFNALSEAYATGDMHYLCTLYSQIPVEDYACNMYQNNVDSSHDQEGIADIEGAAVSGGQ